MLRIASLAAAGVAASADVEIYAARALTRCVAEHWIRLMALLSDAARPAATDPVRPDYWTALAAAERVDADKRIRRSFPNLSIPADIPEWVGAAIRSELVDPEPSDEMRSSAKQVIGEYSFPRLCCGLGASLRGDDWDGSNQFGVMAFAYARFSGCVHGGPFGHVFLSMEGQDRAHAIAATAADLLVPWTTALTIVAAKRHGRQHADTKLALENQKTVIRWIGSVLPGSV